MSDGDAAKLGGMASGYPEWLGSTRGMTLQGASGGGKTTTGRCLHDLSPGPSIVFDLDEEPALGTEVRTVTELAEALAAGEERIVVRSPVTEVREPDLFPDVVRFLIRWGNQLRESGQGQAQFIMGECQDLQQEWVEVAMKRLRKRRIKPVAETQDPISLPIDIRAQAAWNCWVSPPEGEQKRRLRSTDWPLDLLADLPRYDMLVFDRDWNPVDRFRAPEEYAVE